MGAVLITDLTAGLVESALAAATRLPEAEERTRQCLVDWISVILAADTAEGARLLPAIPEAGGATDVLAGAVVRVADAAFANAYHAHLLDFDDVHLDLPGHSGAPVIAAALAVAERDGTDLETLLAGIVAGVEVAAALGRTVGDDLFRLGWHPTAVFGTVGAAVAAAHVSVAGADRVRISNAAALGALQASGAMAGFGSIGKPWQVGEAARKGVIAADAAARVPGRLPDHLGGERGVLALMARRTEAPVLATSTWEPAITGTQFKSYSTCFGTHAAIDAAVRIGRELGGSETVATVGVRVGPDFENVVINPAPATELEAKFSASAVVALALMDRPPIDPQFFQAASDLDEYQRLERATTVRADHAVAGAGAVVEVTTDSGAVLEVALDEQGPRPPAAARPDLVAKYLALAVPVLGEDRAELMLDLIETAPLTSPVRAFVAALRIRPAASALGRDA